MHIAACRNGYGCLRPAHPLAAINERCKNKP